MTLSCCSLSTQKMEIELCEGAKEVETRMKCLTEARIHRRTSRGHVKIKSASNVIWKGSFNSSSSAMCRCEACDFDSEPHLNCQKSDRKKFDVPAAFIVHRLACRKSHADPFFVWKRNECASHDGMMCRNVHRHKTRNENAAKKKRVYMTQSCVNDGFVQKCTNRAHTKKKNRQTNFEYFFRCIDGLYALRVDFQIFWLRRGRNQCSFAQSPHIRSNERMKAARKKNYRLKTKCCKADRTRSQINSYTIRLFV